MDSLTRFATEKLGGLTRKDLHRVVLETDRGPDARVMREGTALISFCCNDYLGLSQHPKVRRAARRAIDRHGVGAGASRLVTGNHPLYRELEDHLAAIKGTEAACVFGSGFLVNSGVIPCFVGAGDLVLIDELGHACLFAGARLSQARLIRFRHNDAAHLQTLLTRHRANHPRCLIATEGVFSMDGDLAPLPRISKMADAFDAWLLSDDAHGFGVVGSEGRGSAHAHPEPLNVALQTGTLSKAVGGYGGYVCATRPVIDWIRNRARTLVYTTGLPPATVAAALAAIDIIESDADLRAAPLAKAKLFMSRLGLPEPHSCIVPIIIGGSKEALAASRALQDQGFLITAIRPPTVAEGTARLRITFSAAHKDEDILRLADAVRDIRYESETTGCDKRPRE
ncbi:MAG: 8-amino-7-oxononanoate synthase [Sphingomonadales bacterium]